MTGGSAATEGGVVLMPRDLIAPVQQQAAAVFIGIIVAELLQLSLFL